MAAKDTFFVHHQYPVKRYEKSVTIMGQSIYFEQPITNDTWFALIGVLEGFAANVYNEGVDDIRKQMREVLGL